MFSNLLKSSSDIEAKKVVGEFTENQDNLIEINECMLCQSKDRILLFREHPFLIVRCTGCDLIYVTPRLKSDSLMKIYGENHWSSSSPQVRGYADYRGDELKYLKTFRKRRRLVRRFVERPGRLLDVGCAAGYFMQVMEDVGWQAHGIDPSEFIVRYAWEKYGLTNIKLGILQEGMYESESFDLITMWDVVEHVPDPLELLRISFQLLRPGGFLVIETQNVASIFAAIMGSRWHHYKHMEHLYHFSPKTIDILLDKAGYKRLHTTARYGGKYISVGFVRERATRIHSLMRPLLMPLALINNVNFYANVMDEMVVVARKP